jgi:tetratricopeptide (TPR) repeat protein
LIDALRWDSKNGYALLMMGNIFAKFNEDIPTAMKYYDQALIANPKDNITINNIGANLMQQGKLVEAKKYFWEAIKIDDKYPNTHFALGMVAEMESDLQSAFYSYIKAIKTNKSKDDLYNNSLQQVFSISKQIGNSEIGKKLFRQYRHKLEFEGEREIDIIQDEQIPTAAKFEFAENYEREKHLVRFNPKYPAYEHLIMHELVHLDFVIDARKNKINQLFISNNEQKNLFVKSIESTLIKLKKLGISEKSLENYSKDLFEGINRQIFNAPIDLFIEYFLYNEYAELRPFQFLSLYTMIQEGLKAVTDKKIVELSPKEVVSKSKIYNLVGAIQFKELFGLDFIKDYQATPAELKTAKDFYDEFLQYRDNKEPAEEYELVLHWAEDLKLDKYFELTSEIEFRSKRMDIDNLLKSIEDDPYGLETKDPYKEREMQKFLKSHEDSGLNMAVVMFMVDALEFFATKPKEEIKKMAVDIAMQGIHGYNPNNSNYRINGIKDKTFSGYHIMAYYYVSWALAIPEMLAELKLPFDEEYKVAQTLKQSK